MTSVARLSMLDNYLTLGTIFRFLFLPLIVFAILYRKRSTGIPLRPRPDLPGPSEWVFVGNLPSTWANRKRILSYFNELEGRYGQLFTIANPWRGRIIVINHPKWLEHVKKFDTTRYTKAKAALEVFSLFPGKRSAIGSEGEKWRVSRKVAQPMFSTKSMNSTVHLALGRVTSRLKLLLHKASQERISIDWNDLSARIALQVFWDMAFSLDADILAGDISDFVNGTLVLSQISSARIHNPAWRLTEKFDGSAAKFAAANDKFRQVAKDMVAARLNHVIIDEQEQKEDWLSIIMSAPEAERDSEFVSDTILSMLFASKDNTQNTFTWCLYELSRNPHWIEKLRVEGKKNGCDGDTIPSFGDLANFPVHLAVFTETLRLWPGIPKNSRMAAENDQLPGIPEHDLPSVTVDKGDVVFWSDFAIGRNRKLWGPDAAEYNPARFLSEDGTFKKPSVPQFHSFGCGPRSCPGQPLATYEFVVIFSSILAHYDLVPTNLSERGWVDSFTLTMDGPFMVNIRPRA